MLVFSACGSLHDYGAPVSAGLTSTQPQEYPSPTEVVEGRLETLQREGVREWSGITQGSYLGRALLAVDESIDNFDYEIEGENRGDTHAEVSLTLRSWDYGTAYTHAFEEVLGEVAKRAVSEYAGRSGEDAAEVLAAEENELTDVLLDISSELLSSAEAAELFSEAFNKRFVSVTKDYTTGVVISLVKDTEGRWTIDDTASYDELIDALYGGLISAARSLRERSADEGYLRGFVLGAQGGEVRVAVAD
jgi:hypothetical protein